MEQIIIRILKFLLDFAIFPLNAFEGLSVALYHARTGCSYQTDPAHQTSLWFSISGGCIPLHGSVVAELHHKTMLVAI
jgi:hypothetical protein